MTEPQSHQGASETTHKKSDMTSEKIMREILSASYEQRNFVGAVLVFLFSAHCYMSVDYYLNLFNGIELFQYGGFADIYQIAWHINSGRTYIAVAILVAYFVFCIVAYIPWQASKHSKIKRTILNTCSLVFLSFIALIIYYSLSLIYSVPKFKAENILAGRTIYFDILRGKESKITCAAIVASTSSYHLLWDYSEEPYFIAIPKPTVLEIKAATIPPPSIHNKFNKFDDPEEHTVEASRIQKDYMNWIQSTENKCGVKITPPKFVSNS